MYNGIYKERCFGYNGWPWTFSTTSYAGNNVLLLSNVSSLLLLFWYWTMRDVVALDVDVVVAAPDVNAFRRLSVPWDFSYSDTWGFSYTSLRPLRLLLLWYLRMMSWIFGLCSKMLWHVSFASFTWIEKQLFRGCEISKMSFVSPTWRQMFYLIVVKIKVWAVLAILIFTWSWITLLLWMFALISSWT